MRNFYSSLLVLLFFSALNGVEGQSAGDVMLKSTPAYDLIRLNIKNSFLFDATVIYFHETFNKGIGPEDSEKMFNSLEKMPEIYTRIAGTNLAIDGLPLLNGDSLQMAICVKNQTSDECEIFSKLDDFMPDYSVVLEDKVLAEYTNLREGSYKYVPLKLGVCSDRFVLHLSKGNDLTTGINLVGFSSGQTVKVSNCAGGFMVDISAQWLGNNAGKACIEIYDLTGQKLKGLDAGAGTTLVNLPGGRIYIVRVVAGERQILRKVVVRS